MADVPLSKDAAAILKAIPPRSNRDLIFGQGLAASLDFPATPPWYPLTWFRTASMTWGCTPLSAIRVASDNWDMRTPLNKSAIPPLSRTPALTDGCHPITTTQTPPHRSACREFRSELQPSTLRFFLIMGAQQAHDHMGAARRVVSERLRVFFTELRAVLDPDTEDFFDRVMRQAETRPQHREG